jgi:RHS repeat-associated protein
MVQAGSAGFTWDKKGNLTSDGTNSYTYSSENLLTGIVNPGGHYATASSPVYDPLGRLYQTGSNFDGNQAETVEDLAGQVVFEYATRGRARRYVFGPEPDELLIQYFTYAPAPQYNSRTWYQGDERGSIASLTGDAGNGGTPNRYDEYGVPAASNFGRYQYTGQFWLAEPSLYYYKARFYDPKLGLFLQTDPKGYDAGPNLYAYVGDDPMTQADPTGEDKVNCLIVDGQFKSCSAVSDDNKNTEVTYTEVRHWTDLRGQEHSKVSSITDTIGGSLLNPSFMQRLSEALGGSTVSEGIEKDIKALTGTEVHLGSPSPWSYGGGYTPTAPAESPVWQNLTNYRNGIKTDGDFYYEFDRRHGEIEVYNKRGDHLGTKNAHTGEWEKPAKLGRSIKDKL